MSRSCHDLPALRSSLGRYDAVFYGPVFASISKRGYGSGDGLGREALAAVLHTRSEFERRTAVLAIGGVNLETACRARALGFDGVAVLGAIWHAADPIGAFNALAAGCRTARLALPVPSPALGV